MSGDTRPARAVLRPSIPPAAWFACALWGGLLLGEACQWLAYAGAGPPRCVLVAMSSVAMAAVIAAAVLRTRMVVLVVIGVTGGFVLAWMLWGGWRTECARLTAARPVRWDVEALSDASTSAFGSSSVCRVVSGVARGDSVVVQWPSAGPVPELGQRAAVTGTFSAPGRDARGARAARTGSVGTVRARVARVTGWAPGVRGFVGPVRRWAVTRLSWVAGDAGALLAGVVAGDRRALAGTQAETDFRTTGLTHLVAVSGSHLVVVAVCVGWLSMRLARSWRSMLIAAVVGGYVVFSGVQPSALRAWVMTCVAAVAWSWGRRVDGGAVLSCAVIVLLASTPTCAFDLGFRLSVAAVAGLVFFGRLGEAWVTEAFGRRFERLSSPVALTLVATVATLPITMSVFGMLSIVAPLANVLVGPLVSGCLVTGLAGLVVSAVWRAGGGGLLSVAVWQARLATWIAHRLAELPFAAVPVNASAAVLACACAAALGCAWAVWPQPTRRRARVLAALGTAVILLVAGGPLLVGSAPGIEMLDVGQGDAILVREGRSAVLVDTGPSPQALRAALGRARVRMLDAVVITHFHADHSGGLSALPGLVRVRQIVVPAGAKNSGSQTLAQAAAVCGTESIREVRRGDAMRLGTISLEVVSPADAVDDPATNEASIVMLVRRERFTALLTGDGEADVLQPLAASGVLGDIDILKVGHHGSAEAVTSGLLGILRPEVALVSVGADNRFGHPKPSTMSLLARAGARTLRTDEQGDVTIALEPTGRYRVSSSKSLTFGASERRAPSGARTKRCATLRTNLRRPVPGAHRDAESHGQTTLRVQARLSHLRGARSPP